MDEWKVDEWKVDEWKVDEWEVDEWWVFNWSLAPTEDIGIREVSVNGLVINWIAYQIYLLLGHEDNV